MNANSEYLSPKEVREYLGGISKTTLFDWRVTRNFPSPVRISAKTILFKKSEIKEWLESRQEKEARV